MFPRMRRIGTGRQTARRGARAFTLIEVLVVVAIIGLLVSILLPSMSRAREMSKRTVCSTRLHNIGVSVQEYANSNKGKIIICHYGDTQVAISPRLALPGTDVKAGEEWKYTDWWAAAKRYRVDKTTWECPNREGVFGYEGVGGPIQGYTAQNLKDRGYQVNPNAPYDQWIIGYQYFGGIKYWQTYDHSGAKIPSGDKANSDMWPGRSPVDNNSKPYWALAADSNLKVDGIWGGGRPSCYGNIPPHPDADGKPAGGNVLTFDGAVTWITRARLVPIHSWGGSRVAYWWQSELGPYGTARRTMGLKPGIR